MNRIQIYSGVYIIILAIYVLFNFVQGLDTLVFVSFVISSILLVFAREELPKSKLTNILQVKQYHQKRVNIHGYVMSTILILCSILYVLCTITFKLSMGVASIIIWPVIIISYLLLIKFLTEKTYKDGLNEYFTSSLNLNKQDVRDIVNFFYYNELKVATSKELEDLFYKAFSSSMSIPLLHETTDKYFAYKLAESNPVSPDEISEINRNS